MYAIRLPSTGPLCVCVCGGGGGAREVRVRGERAGMCVCVCVLSCLLCFVVGSLYNGSRNGVSRV